MSLVYINTFIYHRKTIILISLLTRLILNEKGFRFLSLSDILKKLFSNKDWPAKKVIIYFSIFYLVKTLENTLFFSLHFTWSWNHQRVLEKWPFCKYDSWFSSLVSKLTSVFYPWNNAFSGMEKIYFHKYCPVIVIVLTKCSLYCL